MKKKIITLLLTVFYFQIYAQYDISGKVTDIHNSPLEFVNVLIFKSPDNTFIKGGVTNEKGVFILPKIEAGTYHISASLLGFEEYKSSIFQIGEHTGIPPFEIKLAEATAALDEVTVTAKKPLFEQKIDRTVVNVQNSVTATGSTALQILQRSPGVEIDRINAQISLSGKQGVIVMMNGKRMRIDGETLLQLLENMPSDNIESIELITTPPASFDAEGNAGIINIKTIKKEDEGTNGNINLNISRGKRTKYGGSFNLNMRKKSFNLFADFTANHDYTLDQIIVSRQNIFNEHITDTEILSRRPAFTGLYNGRMGMDYFFNKKTTIGILLSGYSRHWAMGAETETKIMDNIDGKTTRQLRTDEINDWLHGMVNLNFRHDFDEKNQLSFDFDYLKYYDENPISYLDRVFSEENILLEQLEFNSTKETPIDFKVGKIDFTKTVNEKLKIETGLKGTLSNFTNELSLANMVNDEPVFDPRFTDESNLDEKIAAVYISSDYNWTEKWTAKMGVRYEYYDSYLSSRNEGELLSQKFGRFFPTLFLTYQINENEQFQFSYSERINRPAFNNMAPTFFFWGYNTVFAGNPRVRATTSRNLSASFKHKSILFNVQFSDEDHPLTFQSEVVAEENLIITNVANMEDAKTASANLNFPIQMTDWWESRYNFSGTYVRYQPIIEGNILTVKDAFATANVTNNFSLPLGISLELNANFRSARTWGVPRVPFRGRINMGLQKDFGDKGKISLNWNDMFNWGSFWAITIDQPDFNVYYNWKYDIEGNIIRLSYSYNFGNKDLKKVLVRQTGSEEERSRMN